MARWIGRYELLQPIGKGGMAELHLARVDGAISGAHKLCVVKQMLPWLVEDAQFVQMFVDEARLALGLDHPNIVHVHDVGCVAGRYFFVMEYLHGETVARIQAAASERREVVPLAEALSIGVGVAAGLHYAHEKRALDGTPLSIVHRDVSPQNVIVTFDGAVKLLDFGIAKAAHRVTETRQGTIKGKVRYMSPEQVRSEPLDGRADVFALGVMLWELTTGRTLYDGEGDFQIQRRIVDTDARRPSEVVVGYQPELERLVMKALARQREARFASAEELQLAIEELARERKLSLSSVGLSRFMRERFGARVEALRQAEVAGDEAVTAHVLADLASRPRLEAEESVDFPSLSEVGPKTRPFTANPPSPPTEAIPWRGRTVLAAVTLLVAALGGGWWMLRGPAAPAQALLESGAPAPTTAKPSEPVARPSPSAPAQMKTAPSNPSRLASEHPKPVHSAKRAHSPSLQRSRRWDSEAALPPP